ncbi:MAG: AAA family ATPase [Isosphaeraceae bacterium]
MYEEHFGLQSRPFGASAAFLPLPSRDSVLLRLRYGLEQGQGPTLLYGLPGVGKTRLAVELARRMGCRTVHLTFPALPPAELLEWFADELEAPRDAGSNGMAANVRRIARVLTSTTARGGRTLLMVDEAHLVADPATWESLRLLLNFPQWPPALGLLLIGGPELPLDLPPSLEGRLAARALLKPLIGAETAAYVTARLVASGGPPDLFEAGHWTPSSGSAEESLAGSTTWQTSVCSSPMPRERSVSAEAVDAAARELAPGPMAA